MSDQFKGIEPMVYNSKINVPYSWWAGDTASKFYLTLRDEKKIIGTKCGACNKVFLPPRKVCPVVLHREYGVGEHIRRGNGDYLYGCPATICGDPA